MAEIAENVLEDFDNPNNLVGGSGGPKFKKLRPYLGDIVSLEKVEAGTGTYPKDKDQYAWKVALDDWKEGSLINPDDPESTRDEQWHHTVWTGTRFTPGKGSKLEMMFQGILGKDNVLPQDSKEVTKKIQDGARIALTFQPKVSDKGNSYEQLIDVSPA